MSNTEGTMTEADILKMQEQELLCAACDHPCNVELPAYPANFAKNIATDEPLGQSSKHKWHVLICTGVSSRKWPKSLEQVEDSYYAQVNTVLNDMVDSLPGKVTLSAITLASEDGVDPEFECDIVIFPEAVKYKAVKRDELQSVFEFHCLNIQPKKSIPQSVPLLEDTWILICGHKLRDNRCGISAPILETSFNLILEEKNMQNNVFIDHISHIGGHKFAGNVIIHGKDVGEVWYGRVFPYHVNAIVEKTIENKEILSPLVRYRSEDW